MKIGISDAHAIRSMLSGFAGSITASFWSEGDALRGVEPWNSVVRHGAHLVRIETMPIGQAIPALKEDYGFDQQRLTILRSLFRRRLAIRRGYVVATGRERQAIETANIPASQRAR